MQIKNFTKSHNEYKKDVKEEVSLRLLISFHSKKLRSWFLLNI